MRILHTSDWHLGQHFMGKSRQAEHQALIDWLLEQVDVHAVDAVLIAGDIFDTGAPPSYARELYSHLVVRLHRAGVALLLLGGNHDSVATLGESCALLAVLNTTVVGAVHDPAQHVVVLPRRAADMGGPSGTGGKGGTGGTGSPQPGCIVCAVPFIRPRDVWQSQAGQSAEDKQQSLQAALQAYYEAVHAAALAQQAALQQTLGQRLPIIATGHLTTVGASSNESVREIYVGSLDAFPTAAFPPVDYIALGHIHQPQRVGGLEHIRYCGSPIPLGFDEAKQQKEVLLVDLDATGLTAVTPLPVPRFQALIAISGNLATLPAALADAAAQGTAAQPAWLEVTVAEDDYLPDLAERISTLAQGLPVEVLRVRRQRTSAAAALQAAANETLDELSPHDVFARRLAAETLAPELHQALEQRYNAVVHSITTPESAA